MAMDGKRPPLAVMIALKAKKPEGGPHDEPDGDEEGGTEHEPDDGQLAACEDVIDAIKNQDAHMLSKALANWMELYEGQESHEEEHEPEYPGREEERE